MNSHNHAMFGSVGAWFYNALAGINLGDDGEGYRHIKIQPHVVEDLQWASGTVDTIRGRVSSSWTHSPGAIALDVTLPVNSDGVIVIPEEEQMRDDVVIREGDNVIWKEGKYVPGPSGVSGARKVPEGIEVKVGSGHYSFRLTASEE